MKTDLPQPFVERMQELLGGEFDRFMASYDEPRLYGLRINPLKINAEDWKELSPIAESAKPIPWTPTGYYYSRDDRPAKHPHYNAGLYYIQEPSAMAPVELLDVRPGHRVLDLCAAPGGKSTQIAGKLQGKGVLVANDNGAERTKALAKNIELAGVRNAVILNEEPSNLAPKFAGWFDRILVDAPCSGEGMFRKEESMIAAWESYKVEVCSKMQHDILRHAADLLAPGGRLVYSTCTFAPEENEAQIARFLVDRPDFEVMEAELKDGWRRGRPDWIEEKRDGDAAWEEAVKATAGTVRLWPHWIKGEGHYVAVLRRKAEAGPFGTNAADPAGADRPWAEPQEEASWGLKGKKASGGADRADKRYNRHSGEEAYIRAGVKERRSGGKPAGGGRLGKSAKFAKEASFDPAEAWAAFARDVLRGVPEPDARIIAYGARLFLQPVGVPELEGLKVVRPGWYIGDAEKGRFAPSQALALGLKRGQAAWSLNWAPEDEQLIRYLKGETLFVDSSDIVPADRADEGGRNGSPRGYILICVDGYPIGWGIYADGTLKNKLPAGWRVL
ncbi:RsmB/NOP family class I SAM-dependent RNA methyltransferase [Paenibacillus thailandensis]|uniref:RsmB/NOP family class I SAM-dependent RNA methyltransferase n=1 Tax=Paenibacillus thailandensis TaxID=393250 RepID=A0ABW5QZ81_9BACL